MGRCGMRLPDEAGVRCELPKDHAGWHAALRGDQVSPDGVIVESLWLTALDMLCDRDPGLAPMQCRPMGRTEVMRK